MSFQCKAEVSLRMLPWPFGQTGGVRAYGVLELQENVFGEVMILMGKFPFAQIRLI